MPRNCYCVAIYQYKRTVVLPGYRNLLTVTVSYHYLPIPVSLELINAASLLNRVLNCQRMTQILLPRFVHSASNIDSDGLWLRAGQALRRLDMGRRMSAADEQNSQSYDENMVDANHDT